LLGGVTPAVQLAIVPDLFTLDPQSEEAEAGEPRVDDHTDTLPFNVATPAGPYLLSQPPAPGPRRVRLVTSLGDHIALQNSEIVWDALNPRAFTLSLRPDRDVTSITGVQVLYGVVAVFVKVKALQKFSVQLSSTDTAKLQEAEALCIAVIDLNRKQLAEQSGASFTDGDYDAEISVKSLQLLQGASPTTNARNLQFSADVELKATRALAADEGRPILRIRTTSLPLDPTRPVDIEIDVEA
jgi:hypothetical protein